jgi:hypothetical protein
MDFHLIAPDTRTKGSSGDRSPLVSTISKFAPIFFLATFLPFFVFLATSKNNFNPSFLTRADNEKELRVWLEPSSVILNRGQKIKMKVYAFYDSERKFIPTLNINLPTSNEFVISNPMLSYKTPFKGQIIVGDFELTATSSGTYKFNLPSPSISVTGFEDPLTIITASADITVK